MRISSLPNLNLYNRNFVSHYAVDNFNQSDCSQNKSIQPQYFAAYSNINFCGLTLQKLSLKKSTKDYLQISNRFSSSLENISCKLLNKKDLTAYNIDQMKYPYGSIGMKTSFSDLIQSRDFYQCAGLVIFDNKNKEQFLAHIYNKTYIEDIQDTLLKAFPRDSFKEKERLSIFILPGCDKDTKFTINHILKALDMIDEDLSLSSCFIHFNRKNYDCLSVHDGKIFASDEIYKYRLTNTEDMFFFNNPVTLGYDYMRKEIAKLIDKNVNSVLQKANRIYIDFKREVK